MSYGTSKPPGDVVAGSLVGAGTAAMAAAASDRLPGPRRRRTGRGRRPATAVASVP
jgi:hypothetical protein